MYDGMCNDGDEARSETHCLKSNKLSTNQNEDGQPKRAMQRCGRGKTSEKSHETRRNYNCNCCKQTTEFNLIFIEFESRSVCVRVCARTKSSPFLPFCGSLSLAKFVCSVLRRFPKYFLCHFSVWFVRGHVIFSLFVCFTLLFSSREFPYHFSFISWAHFPAKWPRLLCSTKINMKY